MPEHFISPPDPDGPARGEALCRQCARESGSCCRTDPGLTHLSFPLSLPEWRRLAPYARLAAPEGAEPAGQAADVRAGGDAPPPGGDEICAEEANTPDFIASMHRLFPGRKNRVDLLFPDGGRHLTLRTRADGSCVFVGASGCRLPRSARPWYCLLFPAWVGKDSVTMFAAPDCLIARKARGSAHGISLLQSAAGEVRERHERLCRDWNLGKR